MDGCDYTGSWRSVEGHISSKTDEAHRGKLGSHYRERIRATVGDDDSGAQRVESATTSPPSEHTEEATPDAASSSSSSGDGSSGSSEPEPEPEPREESGGLGLAAGTLIIGLAFVISSSTSSDDGSSTSSDDGSSHDGGQATQTATQPRDGLNARFQ